MLSFVSRFFENQIFYTRFTLETKSVTLIFTCTSATSNSSSYHSEGLKNLYIGRFSPKRPGFDVTSLFVFSTVNRIEQNSQQPNSRLHVHPKEEGTVVELTQFETGNDKLLPVLVSVLNSDYSRNLDA